MSSSVSSSVSSSAVSSSAVSSSAVSSSAVSSSAVSSSAISSAVSSSAISSAVSSSAVSVECDCDPVYTGSFDIAYGSCHAILDYSDGKDTDCDAIDHWYLIDMISCCMSECNPVSCVASLQGELCCDADFGAREARCISVKTYILSQELTAGAFSIAAPVRASGR